MARLPWFRKSGGASVGPDPFKDALDEIRSFESLAQNWDSGGALPIQEHVRSRAERFLTETRGVAPRTPDVLATPEGGIDLIWKVKLQEGPARIELHVLDRGTELLVRLQGRRRHPFEERLDDYNAEKTVIHLLKSSIA